MTDVLHVPQETTGERLRRARRSAHLEQEEIANALQVSRSSIGRWENLDDPDHLIVKRPFIEAWARRCNVPFEWLWSGTSDDSGSSWPGAEVLQLAV